MTEALLVNHYPNLYHITSEFAWPQISKIGLLSTTAILDRLQISGNRRDAIESRSRRESVALCEKSVGQFVIRDQKPLPESKLIKGLSGCSVSEWFRILNAKVFLWTSIERVNTLLNAKAYRNQTQQLLTLDTAKLLADYRDAITLCGKNSGAMWNIHPVGPHIFKDISMFDFKQTRTGRVSTPVVEFTVEYAVFNVPKYIRSVDEYCAGKKTKQIYP